MQYTNTHSHKYQVIVRGEPEENTIASVFYFDGQQTKHSIGQCTDQTKGIEYAERYLELRGIHNATIYVQWGGMK